MRFRIFQFFYKSIQNFSPLCKSGVAGWPLWNTTAGGELETFCKWILLAYLLSFSHFMLKFQHLFLLVLIQISRVGFAYVNSAILKQYVYIETNIRLVRKFCHIRYFLRVYFSTLIQISSRWKTLLFLHSIITVRHI